MTTKQQREIERAFLGALHEFGQNTTTEFLIAVTSERTKVEYDEIVDALAAIYCPEPEHSDVSEGSNGEFVREVDPHRPTHRVE
jgi:hypothetical protein